MLPYGDYIYYLYTPTGTEDESTMILCGAIQDLQAIDQTITINNIPYNYLELADADIIFQEDGLESFGIYNTYVVAMTDNADIWVIDVESVKYY